MLLQLCKLDLLALLLDKFRLLLLDRIAIIKSVLRRVSVDVVALLLRLGVVVNFDVAALNVLAIHFDQGLFGTVVSLELDVRETLGLFRLPIVSDTDALDFAEATEPITDIVFFEVIRKTFNKECLAI